MTGTDPTRSDALESIRLERAQLELDKFKEELIHLRKRKPWYQGLGQYSGLLAVLVAALGFGFGIYQYTHEQEKNRTAQERELMKPWLENQRDTYMKAIAAATTIANTTDPAKRKAAEVDFWSLYHGQMILVETKSVSGKMVLFGSCLDGQRTCSNSEMNDRCHALATAMAESMGATARMTFAEFAANQFKYSSGP